MRNFSKKRLKHLKAICNKKDYLDIGIINLTPYQLYRLIEWNIKKAKRAKRKAFAKKPV